MFGYINGTLTSVTFISSVLIVESEIMKQCNGLNVSDVITGTLLLGT